MTAAATGLPILATAANAAWSRRLSTATWAKLASAISSMSAPAAKTFSPPNSTTARISGSASTSRAAAAISSWTCALSAFILARPRRMVAMP